MKKYHNVASLEKMSMDIKNAALHDKNDVVEKLLESFLKDLCSEYGETDETVRFYNAILCLFDGISDKTIYDNLLATHSTVLAPFCQAIRAKNAIPFNAVKNVADTAFSAQMPANSGKIMGIRKSTRIFQNTGVISSWLTGSEMESAAIAACTWGPISPNMVIDSGFLVVYGTKFDVMNTGSLAPDKKFEGINDAGGFTPKEFGFITEYLISHLLSNYSIDIVQKFLEKVFTSVLEKGAQRLGNEVYSLLTEYAKQFCKFQIENADKTACTDKAKWLRALMSSEQERLVAGNKSTAGSCIKYGMELLYPLAPILSREWIDICNNDKSFNFKSKIGFVDNVMLYHSFYANSNQVRVRLLPTASCTFLAGYDGATAEKVGDSSESGKISAAYSWNYNTSDDAGNGSFVIDDLLQNSSLFERGKTYYLTVNFIDLNVLPPTYNAYNITKPSPDPVIPNGFKENDLILVVFGKGEIPVWGKPIRQEIAEKIMTGLDFVAGQEIGAQQEKNFLCRLTKQKTNTVSKDLTSKKSHSYVLVQVAL